MLDPQPPSGHSGGADQTPRNGEHMDILTNLIEAAKVTGGITVTVVLPVDGDTHVTIHATTPPAWLGDAAEVSNLTTAEGKPFRIMRYVRGDIRIGCILPPVPAAASPAASPVVASVGAGEAGGVGGQS